MEINFQVIELVLAVQKYKSLSKVAQAMCISEPALSKQVKRYEEALGYPLLVRNSSGCELTKVGMYVATKGIELLKMRDSLLSDISDIGKSEDTQEKVLRFGLANCYSEALLNRFLPKYVSKYPNVKVELVINTTDTLETMCISDELDLILTQKEYCDSRLNCIDVCKEETVVYLPSKYRFDETLKEYCDKGEIPLKVLEPYPMAAGQGHARFLSFANQYYEEANFKPNIIFQSESWPTILSLVKNKMCYSVMPDIFDVTSDDILKLHIQSKYPTSRTLVIAYKQRSSLPDEWKKYISTVKENIE